MDPISKKHRSWNMSRIRGRDTTPEYVVRSIVHRLGFRFRLHRKDLPGKPDLVLPKYRTVIFVHGCYWHRHPNCKCATTPSTNKEFWLKKFDENVARDGRNQQQLSELDWSVVVFWECEIKEHPVATVTKGLRQAGLFNRAHDYPKISTEKVLKVAEERFERSWESR